MSKKKKCFAFFSLACIISIVLSVSAFASVGGGITVAVGYTGQTVDTIRFNGVTVEAKYAPGGGYGSSEYSCAALVMKFYKAVYGFDVWNLSSSAATPTCSNGESFTQTTTPRVGDIVRFQDRTHWALVKAVNGSTVTLIEQNWGYYASGGYVAAVNRTVELGDAQVSYFTYSAYGRSNEPEKEPEQSEQVQFESWEEAVAVSLDKELYSIESEDNLKLLALEQEVTDTLSGAFVK